MNSTGIAQFVPPPPFDAARTFAAADADALFTLLTTPDDNNGGFQYLQSAPVLPSAFWDWDWDGTTLRVTYDVDNGPALPNGPDGNPVDPETW